MSPLSSLPPLREVIRHHNLLTQRSLSKGLGQHFLLDPTITDSIAKASGSLEGYVIIEVGPGPGGLTRALLEQNPYHVCAIEKDKRCVRALQPLVEAAQGKLTVIEADAKKIQPSRVLESIGKKQKSLKIISNLPYNVGTALFIQWLKNLKGIDDLVLMFQREVALRISAKPGAKDYGRLSVLSQYLCSTERLFDLPPRAFMPPPQVYSTVIRAIPRQLSQDDQDLVPFLEKITAAAFCGRRKMIRTTLGPILGKEIFTSLGIFPDERPENLTIPHYISLARVLFSSLGNVSKGDRQIP